MTPTELKEVRYRLGLTQGEFASVVGVEGEWRWRTVSRWEAGDRRIPKSVDVIVDLIRTVPGVKERLRALNPEFPFFL